MPFTTFSDLLTIKSLSKSTGHLWMDTSPPTTSSMVPFISTHNNLSHDLLNRQRETMIGINLLQANKTANAVTSAAFSSLLSGGASTGSPMESAFLYFEDTNENAFFVGENFSIFNNLSLVKCEKSSPDYPTLVNGYIMPILLMITLITNTLVVIVLSQREMRTPTNLVLLAMAISDLFTLIFPAPVYFYWYTLGHCPASPSQLCYASQLLTDVVPMFFHTASIWLTLVLAGQRYVYVCHPTVAPNWCTLPKVSRAIVITFVLSFASIASRFVDRDYHPVRVMFGDGQSEVDCLIKNAEWVSEFGQDIYYTLFYIFRILFVNIGPCATLVILNLLLFRALRQAQYTRAKLFKDNRRSECKRICDTNCTTLMLIVVVSVFLSTEIPAGVIQIVHVLQNLASLNIADYDTLNLAILATNFIISVSYPFNFAIYCGMSKQFRETFKALFIPGAASSTSSASRREGSTRYSVANGPRTSTHETVL